MIESEAREADEMLCVMQSLRYKHASYRQTTAQDRLAAMCNNEIKNRHGKYETLENAKLNDKVLDEIKDECVSLETALMEAEKGGKKLILVAEQGDGKYSNNVTVVLNPAMKEQAKKWIVEACVKLKFRQERELRASVKLEEVQMNSMHNESLKEFLKASTNEKEIAKSKHGKKLKTHAEVIGIKENNNQKKEMEKNEENNKQYNNKKRKEKPIKQEMEEAIEMFQQQIKQLKEMIVIICKTVVKDDEIKDNMLKKMEQIINIETKEEEIKEIEKHNQYKKQKYVQEHNKEASDQNEEIKVIEKKQLKVKGHPKVSIDATGDVIATIEWCNKMRQERREFNSQRAQIRNGRNE